jgi:hypothetical protein
MHPQPKRTNQLQDLTAKEKNQDGTGSNDQGQDAGSNASVVLNPRIT